MPRETCILADNSLMLAYTRQSLLIDKEMVEAVSVSRELNLGRKEAA
jgi:hypothetical protein